MTTAEQALASLGLVMLAGQMIAGFCVSLTVTLNEHFAGLPLASCTMQVTVLTPFGNVAPGGGVQLTLPIPEQLSLAGGKV